LLLFSFSPRGQRGAPSRIGSRCSAFLLLASHRGAECRRVMTCALPAPTAVARAAAPSVSRPPAVASPRRRRRRVPRRPPAPPCVCTALPFDDSALPLRGKTVGVVGLGASGEAAALLALALGARCVVGADARPEAPPLASRAALVAFASSSSRIESILGPHPPGALAGADLVVASPGVTPAAVLAVARLASSGSGGATPVVVSEMALAAAALGRLPDDDRPPLVVVTGTNGKSTTTLMAACLGHAAVSEGRGAWAGGNLGDPLSSLALALMTPNLAARCPRGRRALAAAAAGRGSGRKRPRPPIAVVEASSYQLASLGPVGAGAAWPFSPPALGATLADLCTAAAVTGLSPDHLDRHGCIDAYAASKVSESGGSGRAVRPSAPVYWVLAQVCRSGSRHARPHFLYSADRLGMGIVRSPPRCRAPCPTAALGQLVPGRLRGPLGRRARCRRRGRASLGDRSDNPVADCLGQAEFWRVGRLPEPRQG